MNDDEITDEIDKKYEKLLDAARGIDTTSDELNEESADGDNLGKSQDETSASNVIDMMLGKQAEKTIDSETMIQETQKRIWKSLKHGIESISIEIDEQLINLQKNIIQKTDLHFKTINTDATQTKFTDMKLKRPVFFIGGVPQNGEMLAESIIKNILAIPELEKTSCFVLTGTLAKEKFLKNKLNYGWETTLKKFHLMETEITILPTYWTMEQSFETPYIFTKYT